MKAVRKVRESDYSDWLRLWREYLLFYKSQVSDEITLNTWNEILNPDGAIKAFVAEIDSKVCGIAHCFLRPSTWHEVGYLYLEDLFVDQRYRGRGIGRELLDKAASYGREIGAERLYWITKEDNEVARRLYDSYVSGGSSGFIQYEYRLDRDEKS
jgi:ribosomal protein S18 acetylase RimI-like enzyme